MAAPVRIEVNIKEFIKILEKKQAEAASRYNEQVKKWEEAVKASAVGAREIAAKMAKMTLTQMVKAAKEAMEPGDNGRPSRYRSSWKDILDVGYAPDVPAHPESPECYDNRLNLLRMSTTDTMKITLDQYENALRGCW